MGFHAWLAEVIIYELVRKLLFYQAMVEVVQLFGETEIGTCEVDTEAVATYISSLKFPVDMWGISSKDEVYQKLTDDILNGFPVWQLLKVSDWTKQRLENTFKKEIEDEEAELKKKYKCYSCRHYYGAQTAIGLLEKCNRPVKWNERRDVFEPKKRCKYYERIANES